MREVIMRLTPTADEDAEHAVILQVLVRCGECIHHIDAPKTDYVWCERVDGLLPRDWFCKDGERKGEEEKWRKQ